MPFRPAGERAPADFVHLHVASGYSLRYGASTPADLVATAVEQGMSALALTDRDGLYGAIKFALACRSAGLGAVFGVDLALAPEPGEVVARAGSRRSPVRGGVSVDPRHPRVTVLALGPDPEQGRAAGQGWSRLCRLVTATHLRGVRGVPLTTEALLAEHAAAGHPPGGAGDIVAGGIAGGDIDSAGRLVVLLGPESPVGRAVSARRRDLAVALVERWRAMLPPGSLALEVVCHHGPPDRPGSLGHAARMLALARQTGVPAVLTNAVRYTSPEEAATADVLDAARRLVPLDLRHLDRVSNQEHLAGPGQMARTAAEIATAAGEDDGGARLLADTMTLASRCLLDPAGDLGIGSVHLPEPHVLGLSPGDDPLTVLRKKCDAAIGERYPGAGNGLLAQVEARLEKELEVIETLGFASYFLTVGLVCADIRSLGVRVAARGSGAGSLVNHLLRISGVDPIRHNLLMERFLSPLRTQLPDIDVDVESARREEVYAQILDRFGADRVSCVSMMDTYRVRHAIRDVGAALGMPPADIGTIATAFPHIRARDVRDALTELPELRAAGLASPQLDLLFDLVERLDGLPRHIAVHPCGVLLSDAGLGDRTPVEASWQGLPMSQFDKDDVEDLGLLKLDVLGIRMQSAMAYAIAEASRVDDVDIDLDALPLDDEPTFRMIRTSRTLGCFQIESPGQRELIGRFGPETFTDLVIDISLFRPGPVKSDMINPFLRARHGWDRVEYLHPSLIEALEETSGVVVFHEQVLQIVAAVTGCTLAQADEVRRAMGSKPGQHQVRSWFFPRAAGRGYPIEVTTRIWAVLESFASFGFCRAHAAAFALPTYQSAWLKRHHPAAFLAGVLTHDPGMYPKRLLLDEARNLGGAVLPLDVNVSGATYAVERLEVAEDHGPAPAEPDLPDGRGYGIRLALAEVKGISDTEVASIVAGRPYADLADFWHRAATSRPVVENLVLAGAFDSLYGLSAALPTVGLRRRDRVTRRDLLLHIAELDAWSRARRAQARTGSRRRRPPSAPVPVPVSVSVQPSGPFGDGARTDPLRSAAAAQSRAPAPVADRGGVQLALDLGDAPTVVTPTGLPELTGAERTRAELEILGLDVSRHVLEYYQPLLDALRVTRSRHLLQHRSREGLLVAGVKVATQTPPVRSGRRVVFLTLDDGTGPVDATFFEDAQGPYAATVFHSWLLLVRGELRRTGKRGVSLRATGAWELPVLWQAWVAGGIEAVLDELDRSAPTGSEPPDVVDDPSAPYGQRRPAAAFGGGFVRTAEQEYEAAAAAEAGTGLPVGDRALRARDAQDQLQDVQDQLREQPHGRGRSGGMGGAAGAGVRLRRVLVAPTGYVQSPYADLQTPGVETRDTRRSAAAQEQRDQRGTEQETDRPERSGRAPARKLWHSSQGSSGR